MAKLEQLGLNHWRVIVSNADETEITRVVFMGPEARPLAELFYKQVKHPGGVPSVE